MKLSIYTFVQNGLYYDFHVVAMLKHHLLLADEIVVLEGNSSDGTYDAIKNIDPKIRIVRKKIDPSDAKSWLRSAKNEARLECTGDWCILLDCDEFIPEWEFERIRASIENSSFSIYAAAYKHFYGNFKVFYDNPDRNHPPKTKRIIHRNLDDVEILGDGSDVCIPSLGEKAFDSQTIFECHHFGEVRNAARLRHKWRIQFKRDLAGKWDWLPGFVFDLLPHRWLDPDIVPYLHLYEGPFVRAVRDDPKEFIRDDMKTYKFLAKKLAKIVTRP